jgi:hypothetical protein
VGARARSVAGWENPDALFRPSDHHAFEVHEGSGILENVTPLRSCTGLLRRHDTVEPDLSKPRIGRLGSIWPAVQTF